MSDENKDVAAELAAERASRVKLEAKVSELLDEVKAERAKRREADEAKAAAEEAARVKAEEAAAKSGDVDEVRRTLEARHAAAIKKAQDEANEYRSQLHRRVVDASITEAMARENIAPSLSKAAALLFKDGRNIEIKDGEAFVDGVPIADAVTEWAGADGVAFKAAGQSTGGGAPGGGKSAGGTLADMTEQDRLKLARENPARFREMRAAAG